MKTQSASAFHVASPLNHCRGRERRRGTQPSLAIHRPETGVNSRHRRRPATGIRISRVPGHCRSSSWTVTSQDSRTRRLRSALGRSVGCLRRCGALGRGAQGIVTCSKFSDFRELPDGVETQRPDEFLWCLPDLAPDMLPEIVRAQSRDLGRPPRTFSDMLGAARRVVPGFVEALRAEVAGMR